MVYGAQVHIEGELNSLNMALFWIILLLI